jgi:C4-dicarboxylate-binding protein DctP
MRKHLIAIAAAAVLAGNMGVAQAEGACDPGEVVIKFSHVTNTDKHPKGIAAELLAKRVNEEMNGKACMQVYPNSSLYNDDKVLEAMLNGDVQMAAPSLSKFEQFTKKFRLFDLPFLFKDIDAVDRFQTSEDGQKLMSSMKRRGLQGLGFWHNGMKELSANKPLIKPEDAKGLKFRVQASDVLVAQFEQLGANPQKMAFSEVYGALQTKTIDGSENPWCNIWGQKFFEVQDGITETDHGVLDYMVVSSTKFLDSLKPEVRDQLMKIVAEVTVERNAAVKKVDQECRQKVADTGTVIRVLTPEQRQAWVDAMKPVWKKFEGDIGAELMDAALKANN